MSSAGQPLSPPGPSSTASTQHGLPQLVVPQRVDSNQLKARLYGKSEIQTSTKPVLKVVRRRPRRDEVRELQPWSHSRWVWIHNYTTLYHFLSISLDEYNRSYTPVMYNYSLYQTCTMYRIVYTKLNYSLLSHINWIYYLYLENIFLA